MMAAAAEAAVTTIRDEAFQEHVVGLLKKIETIPQSSTEIFLWDLLHMSMGDLLGYRLSALAIKHNPDVGDTLVIKIISDRRNNTLSIIDTGRGMTEEALMERIVDISEDDVNLFTENIDKYLIKGDDPSGYYDIDGICLGVYAAFMVANRVVITTKLEDNDHVLVWESKGLTDSGSGSYSITHRGYDDRTTLLRGTWVTLYLKDEHFSYLDEEKLVSLVCLLKSDHCSYPIELLECSAEGEWSTKEELCFRDDEEKIEDLVEKFEVLRKLCVQCLGRRLKEERIIISDRVFDLPCALSADKKWFEINPRNHLMKALLEDYNNNREEQWGRVMETFQMHYQLFSARIMADPLSDFLYRHYYKSSDDDEEESDADAK